MLFITRVSTDCIAENKGKLLVVRRNIPPFRGKYCFPGGHLKFNESVEECVVRETYEETGVKVEPKEILGVYSKKNRDPRGHIVSIVFVCKPINNRVKSSFEGEAEWMDVKLLKNIDMAFDHKRILEDYLKWKRRRQTFWSGKDG
ncbi:MAG: NUDIX hydrolase [Candidatus Aenigmarchaeota archaeon]|nr:NUDIX hydrolase [Candidatus Aenigmarchaeota archaeon]MCX8190772.1 NUDIX hydrolase [Candidatus Aenigmarchaeota archaeon]MDW8160019.1 NUDIX hydrolase [Candidatus Aenigmarchaeota archaeon]